jgi:hypothetical protein
MALWGHEGGGGGHAVQMKGPKAHGGGEGGGHRPTATKVHSPFLSGTWQSAVLAACQVTYACHALRECGRGCWAAGCGFAQHRGVHSSAAEYCHGQQRRLGLQPTATHRPSPACSCPHTHLFNHNAKTQDQLFVFGLLSCLNSIPRIRLSFITSSLTSTTN